jgi:hypothetical protein
MDRRLRPFPAAEQRVLDLLAALVSQAIALRSPCAPYRTNSRRL